MPDGLAATDNPWLLALRVFTRNVRRSILAVILCALVGGGLGLLVKSFLPRTYYAYAQLLFDPQGFKVFNNALKSGLYDANSAINHVEGQMVVLRSERVLSRIIRAECRGVAGPAVKQSGSRVGPILLRRCPNGQTGGDWLKAVNGLGKSLNIYRSGRSFVVTIQASGSTPQSAARLAAAVVKAYQAENKATRAAAAKRLTSELTARLKVLRSKLRASELAAERYARSKNLQRVAGRFPVEQQLISVTANLAETSRKVEQTQTLYQTLKSGKVSASSLAALPGNINAQALRQMLARRSTIQSNIAALSGRAGRRHPARIALSGKLAKLNRSIRSQVGAIRRAAATSFRSAKAEQLRLQTKVKKLGQRLGNADRATIALNALKQKVNANKRVVEAFETRVREASEFSRIDVENLRIVSEARIPALGRKWPRQVLAALIGMFIGTLVAISGILLLAVIQTGPALIASGSATRRQESLEETPKAPMAETQDDSDVAGLRAIALEMRRRGPPRLQEQHRHAS